MKRPHKPLKYQIEAVSKIYENKKGIFAMITGSGKTLVQGHIIKELSEINNDKFGVFIYVTPTILLNYQTIDDYRTNVFYPHKKNYSYHFIHSGDAEDNDDIDWLKYVYEIPPSKDNYSTKLKNCKSAIEKAFLLNKPIVLGTTYASLVKVANACIELNIKPEVVIFDEAKYVVNQKIQDVCNLLNPKRKYFFTPIEKYTKAKEGLGMQNTDFFGDTIFEYDAEDSIKNGTMVPPKIMIAHGENGQYTEDDLNKSIHKIINETFIEYRTHFKKYHKELSPKIIVPIRGIDDIIKFLNSEFYGKLINEGVKIYAAHSKSYVGYNINGIKYKKPTFLKQLKEDGNNDKVEMIILHFDILTRGIDVPGINGWMPWRSMNLEGTVNSMGRGGRVHKIDRERIFETKELNACDFEKYVKPCFYTIFLDITGENKDDAIYFEDIISKMLDGGLDPNDDAIHLGMPIGRKDPTQPDGTNISFNPKGAPKSVINKIILKQKDIYLESQFKSMSPLEKLQKYAPLSQ